MRGSLSYYLREVVQESLGFSLVEMVFEHTIRDPLKVLKDRLLEDSSILRPKKKCIQVCATVSRTCVTGSRVCPKKFMVAQNKMKSLFDVKAKRCEFRPGKKVLVLLPIRFNIYCSIFRPVSS